MNSKRINVKELIEKRRASSPEFKELWDSTRMEYRILGELMKTRKEKGVTQKALAEKIGSNQRMISLIEKHGQSPTLKTLCNLAEALDMEIKLVPRSMG